MKTAGSRGQFGRWAHLVVGLTVSVSWSPSCSKSKNNIAPPTDNFDRNALLQSLGAHVFVPAYETFQTEAKALAVAVEAYKTALGVSDGAAERKAAREAWGRAMAAWQQAEIFQLGPAGIEGQDTGGKNLRDEIYSWPTAVNTCSVDQEVVNGEFGAPDFFSTHLITVYGLDALEYLLFNEALVHTCATQVGLDARWNVLSAEALTQSRANYADAVAAHLLGDANTLVEAWSSASGNFITQLGTAGQSGSPYPSAQGALDEVLDALFYVEVVTKDRKLSKPLGFRDSCGSSTCPARPDERESRWANHSKENIIANLQALRSALTGGGQDNMGFEDMLQALGAKNLAETMLQDIDAAIAEVEVITPSLAHALVHELGDARSAHAAVKKVTDGLKGSFATVLMLKLPQEGAGDAD